MHQFLTNAASIFHFKNHFAWFWANQGIVRNGPMIHFYKSKQQIVLSWQYFYPFSPAYSVIKIFFTEFGEVWFFKKDLKRKKMKLNSKIIFPRLIHVFVLKFSSYQRKRFRLQFFADPGRWFGLFIEYANKQAKPSV